MTVIVFLFLNSNAQDEEVRGHYKSDGLYLSMALGGGYLSINNDITNGPYNNMKMKGPGMAFDFKLGGAVKDNLILHADIMTVNSSSADVTADGEELGTISGDNSVGVMMFGAGTTYYFMPQNVFISGTLGIGGFTITSGENTSSTQKGFGLFVKLGKEWWISKNWDLGLSAGFNYTNVNNKADDMTEKLSGTSFGLCVNATFN